MATYTKILTPLFWRLAQSTTTSDFIEYLKKYGDLKEYKFRLPHRSETRFVWKEASDYQIVLSLKPKSYFSHFTALYLHQLTTQIPKTLYLNFEQPPKSTVAATLAQDRIDFAFRRPCRVTNNITEFKNMRVCILNGKYTDQLGVIDFKESSDRILRIAGLERTLIDITVRPVYSGGVQIVLEAFRAAQDRVSINKLAAMLKSIAYIYPYHQAIGFYLEKAGVYSKSQIHLLSKFPQEYDFYLTHQMKNPSYSKRWRIYYPNGL
jgi:predicted transcriptional regulator of viral defense system